MRTVRHSSHGRVVCASAAVVWRRAAASADARRMREMDIGIGYGMEMEIEMWDGTRASGD